jgi:hypothetical protein
MLNIQGRELKPPIESAARKLGEQMNTPSGSRGYLCNTAFEFADPLSNYEFKLNLY